MQRQLPPPRNLDNQRDFDRETKHLNAYLNGRNLSVTGCLELLLNVVGNTIIDMAEFDTPDDLHNVCRLLRTNTALACGTLDRIMDDYVLRLATGDDTPPDPDNDDGEELEPEPEPTPDPSPLSIVH